MIYGGEIVTPASTAASSPQETVFDLTRGLVYHLKVYFPPGPSGLLHVQVFHSTYQVFPTTLGKSFQGDNVLMEWDVSFPLDAAPYQLRVLTWNLDDTYEHECHVYLALESAEEYLARYLPNLQADRIAKTMQAQEIQAAAARRERVDAFLGRVEEETGEIGGNEVP